jgi:hypothetical protein
MQVTAHLYNWFAQSLLYAEKGRKIKVDVPLRQTEIFIDELALPVVHQLDDEGRPLPKWRRGKVCFEYSAERGGTVALIEGFTFEAEPKFAADAAALMATSGSQFSTKHPSQFSMTSSFNMQAPIRPLARMRTRARIHQSPPPTRRLTPLTRLARLTA